MASVVDTNTLVKKLEEKNFETCFYENRLFVNLNMSYKNIIVYITLLQKDGTNNKWMTTSKYYRFGDNVRITELYFNTDEELIEYLIDLNNKLTTSKFEN
jgi:hypothetical protein